MTTGYYLIDHPNPHGNHFYTSRNRKLIAQVIHVTASLEDIDLIGTDRTCEAEANYAATTDREVSWNTGSDTDSFIKLLPYSYTAFQCINYNSSTVGHEISKSETNWRDDNPEVVRRRLIHAADAIRGPMKAAGIPFRKATKAEVDHAIATNGPPVGMISHHELDPTRRRDPGWAMIGGVLVDTFPWNQFIEILKNGEEVDPMAGYSLADDDRGLEAVKKLIEPAVQAVLKGGANGSYKGLPVGEVSAVQQVENKVDQVLEKLAPPTA